MSEKLPEGWASTRLPQIANLLMGQSPPGSTYNKVGDGLPFFQGKTDFGPRYPTARVWCSKPSRVAEAGDVLISIRAPVGPTNVADRQCAIGRGLAAVRPLTDISTEWILHVLALRQRELEEKGTGSTFTAINRDVLEDIEVPVAPLAEQRRIVDQVENLLAEVNSSRQRLAKLPAILRRLRQSVLAAACSGRLTANWRKSGSTIEPVSSLLPRAEEFRKANIAGANQKGKSKQFRYKPAAQIDIGNLTKGIEDLFELPETWEWASLGQLTWSVADGPHFSPKYVEKNEGVPFVSGRNISYGGVDFGDAKYVSRKDHEEFSKRARPVVGDVLLTKGGTTGIATVVTQKEEFSIWVHVALLKVVKELVTPQYLRDALSAPFVYVQSQAQTHGVGNQDLGLTRMVHMAIPVPPLAEQQEIVERVREMFALADELEARVVNAQTVVDKLPSSLLARAFCGKLVPTEAELALQEGRDYEPASALLERIRARMGLAGIKRGTELESAMNH